MREPLFWNPLSDCASWLSERTGRPIDPRTVVDAVAKMGRQGDPTPTIIGIPIPRERGVVRVMMIGHPDWDTPQTHVQQIGTRLIERQFGPPPFDGIHKYLVQIHPTFAFLCVSHLMRLLIYGRSELAIIDEPREHAHEQNFLMPWDGGHVITIEACGIKRDDLVALGEALALTFSPAATKAAPASEEGAPAAMPDELLPGVQRNDGVRLKKPLQEQAILTWLRSNGFDPRNLPDRDRGRGGPKRRARIELLKNHALFSSKSFEKIWQSLRADGEIEGAR